MNRPCPSTLTVAQLVEGANNAASAIIRREMLKELECRALATATEFLRIEALLNTPEIDDFAKGTVLEACHQRERWSSDHDAGKSPFDWFWLIGYLAQKAASAAVHGDADKAKHHTISTAAALANWHLALSGADTKMRPGIAAQ